jgi:hypothetical protein
MGGKYLRRRIPNAPQDPTMTHVDDPWAFRAGEYILGHYGCYLITAIDDYSPDIRFAHIVKMSEPPTSGIVHDVRENEIETFVWGACPPITKEQARAFLEGVS